MPFNAWLQMFPTLDLSSHLFEKKHSWNQEYCNLKFVLYIFFLDMKDSLVSRKNAFEIIFSFWF